MFKIFIGLLFLFLDLNLHGVNVTPAFVGYALIWLGMGEIKECLTYQRARPLAALAGGVSLVYWLRGFVDQSYGALGLTLMVVVLTLQLLMTNVLNRGVAELQSARGINLRGRDLVIMWNLMAIGSIVVVTARASVPALAMGAVLIYFAGSLGYAVFYWQAGRIWKSCGGSGHET